MDGCCEPGDRDSRCVFGKALLVRAAGCECAARRSMAEGEWIECLSRVAHRRCAGLLAAMHERARFALKLPVPGRALLHVQAMRLQCGGLLALEGQIGATSQAAGEEPAATATPAASANPAPVPMPRQAPPVPELAPPTHMPTRVPNVHQLALLAHERFDGFGNLPWDRIVRTAAAWTPRRRLAPRAADRRT